MPTVTTPYQSQYIAWLLSRRMGADVVDMLVTTLVDAVVDLNPNHVEAALFAFHNPLSRGVILADEVGLEKTVEAGLSAKGLTDVISEMACRKLTIGLMV